MVTSDLQADNPTRSATEATTDLLWRPQRHPTCSPLLYMDRPTGPSLTRVFSPLFSQKGVYKLD
ncbi:hypothetical protein RCSIMONEHASTD_54 [Rhodobacter phage RcSimone-Hastad]|nr:hypothetical protein RCSIMONEHASTD_54 [Rhodobacter phage RcSimone-Hastad]